MKLQSNKVDKINTKNNFKQLQHIKWRQIWKHYLILISKQEFFQSALKIPPLGPPPPFPYYSILIIPSSLFLDLVKNKSFCPLTQSNVFYFFRSFFSKIKNFQKFDNIIFLSAGSFNNLFYQSFNQSKLIKPTRAPNSHGKKKSSYQGIEPGKLPLQRY